MSCSWLALIAYSINGFGKFWANLNRISYLARKIELLQPLHQPTTHFSTNNVRSYPTYPTTVACWSLEARKLSARHGDLLIPPAQGQKISFPFLLFLLFLLFFPFHFYFTPCQPESIPCLLTFHIIRPPCLLPYIAIAKSSPVYHVRHPFRTLCFRPICSSRILR